MRIQGIVLKKIPLREHDELVMVYTKDFGKQRYIAKSITRSTSLQGRHVDVLNHIDFSVVESARYPIITSAHCVNAFSKLKQSLPALSAAYFINQCFNELVFEGESDPALWGSLVTSLELFDNDAYADADWRELLASRYSELMARLGYGQEGSARYGLAIPTRELHHSKFLSFQFFNHIQEMIQ